jgi:hypothetical protein
MSEAPRWEEIHQTIREGLFCLGESVQGADPSINSSTEVLHHGPWAWMGYQLFAHADPSVETIVVTVVLVPESTQAQLRADITGEESGRYFTFYNSDLLRRTAPLDHTKVTLIVADLFAELGKLTSTIIKAVQESKPYKEGD